jgi:hypothetical protein
MTTSNRILLITTIVILSVIAISITGMMIIFSNGDFSSKETAGNGLAGLSKDFVVSNFTGVVSGGIWQVEIVHGDSFGLTVTAPENIIDAVKPVVSGSVLQLQQVLGIDPRKTKCTATIRMPSLASVEAHGNSKISFSGFMQDRMSIEAIDASEVKGVDSAIASLVCSANQSAVVDLSGCSVTDSDFDASLAAKITLRITGGSVKGKVAASAVFAYLGEPLEMEIEASGSAKIRKLKTP